MTNTAPISMYAGPTAPAYPMHGPTVAGPHTFADPTAGVTYPPGFHQPAQPTGHSYTGLPHLPAHYVHPNPFGTITQPVAALVQPVSQPRNVRCEILSQ
ncbi:hypothetical protein Tco_1025738 [Tanacetum coccineum]